MVTKTKAKTVSFTVDEILSAAALNKLPNFNEAYIRYDGEYDNPHDDGPNKPSQACVIGEAFLNLGLTENGLTAAGLSHALRDVYPDDGPITLKIEPAWGGAQTFDNLSEFINVLNDYVGWRGKKRITKLARKYFSESLNQIVTITETGSRNEGWW